MELDASLSWLALALTPGLASRLSARLLREFGSPEEVFRAPLPRLQACNLPGPVAQAVFKKQSFKRAEKELALTRRIDRCRLLNWTEPEYPQTLLQIYDPPVMLYVRGDAEVLNLPSISIVGTRRPTLYGTQMAERLGRELAARGLVVVSGLARGIDAISHQGALAVNGRAVGILGTGIDVCYPKENRKLYEKVLERGVRGSRQCHSARELRAQPAHQARRQAGHQRRRCNRGAAHTDSRDAGARRGARGRAAELVGRGVLELVGKKDLRPAERGRAKAHRRHCRTFGVELFRGSGYAV